ncbi:AAA family ATPase, partial [Blautia producta]|nr:AAA family ATPase [Blautia producta]
VLPTPGKTAITEGLAHRIVWGLVPENMLDKRVVVLDLSGMVAGSKYRGEFEERIKKVVQEVMNNKGILLFMDRINWDGRIPAVVVTSSPHRPSFEEKQWIQ